MRALFIGRFQPFHVGHLSVIQKALQVEGELMIGIGSASDNFSAANPFTCSERIQMIEAALTEAGIPKNLWSVYPVPNIENYGLWPQHVEMFIPPFVRVYTGSDVVKKLFEEYNKKLASPYEIVTVTKELRVSSTDIRDRMLKKRKWEYLVPDSVARLIHEWGGMERLAAVQEATK